MPLTHPNLALTNPGMEEVSGIGSGGLPKSEAAVCGTPSADLSIPPFSIVNDLSHISFTRSLHGFHNVQIPQSSYFHELHLAIDERTGEYLSHLSRQIR
jgi:hypothetical protein